MFLLFLISAGILTGIQLVLGIACLRKESEGKKAFEAVPISVIIAARNEEKNLQRYLPDVLGQAYTDFEVILVLDRCTDESKKIVSSLQANYPQLRFLEIESVPENWAGKKWALNQGILAAKHEFLAFTDADCRPENQWLSTLAQKFSLGYEVILGVGNYFRYPGFLNIFIQFETLYTCLQYIGWARIGLPYMGIGRNLAYTRAFFLRNGGFEAFKSRMSGDDDILINKYADSKHTTCMLRPLSKTYSQPKTSLKSWISQKLRHLSASPAYSRKSKLFLGILHISHMIFYLSPLFFWDDQRTLWFFWASLIVRTVSSASVFYLLGKKLDMKQTFYLFPVLDLLYFIYNLSLVPLGYIQKRTAWS